MGGILRQQGGDEQDIAALLPTRRKDSGLPQLVAVVGFMVLVPRVGKNESREKEMAGKNSCTTDASPFGGF